MFLDALWLYYSTSVYNYVGTFIQVHKLDPVSGVCVLWWKPAPKQHKMYMFTSPWTARPLDYSFSGFRTPRQLPKPVKPGIYFSKLLMLHSSCGWSHHASEKKWPCSRNYANGSKCCAPYIHAVDSNPALISKAPKRGPTRIHARPGSNFL